MGGFGPAKKANLVRLKAEKLCYREKSSAQTVELQLCQESRTAFCTSTDRI